MLKGLRSKLSPKELIDRRELGIPLKPFWSPPLTVQKVSSLACSLFRCVAAKRPSVCKLMLLAILVLWCTI